MPKWKCGAYIRINKIFTSHFFVLNARVSMHAIRHVKELKKSLCWPDVSPHPHKGLIICTSRSWETSLEKTHGTYSDRVRSIVQIFFLSCIRSESLQLLHRHACFFHTSCLDVKKKKRATKELAVLGNSVGCLHMLCNRFTAKGRVDGGRRRFGARLSNASRPSSARLHLQMHTGPVFV